MALKYIFLLRTTSERRGAEHNAFLSPSVPHPACRVLPPARHESLSHRENGTDLFNPLAFSLPLPPDHPSILSRGRRRTRRPPYLPRSVSSVPCRRARGGRSEQQSAGRTRDARASSFPRTFSSSLALRRYSIPLSLLNSCLSLSLPSLPSTP